MIYAGYNLAPLYSKDANHLIAVVRLALSESDCHGMATWISMGLIDTSPIYGRLAYLHFMCEF